MFPLHPARKDQRRKSTENCRACGDGQVENHPPRFIATPLRAFFVEDRSKLPRLPAGTTTGRLGRTAASCRLSRNVVRRQTPLAQPRKLCELPKGPSPKVAV